MDSLAPPCAVEFHLLRGVIHVDGSNALVDVDGWPFFAGFRAMGKDQELRSGKTSVSMRRSAKAYNRCGRR